MTTGISILEDFALDLACKAPNTAKGYTSDVAGYAQWVVGRYFEPFDMSMFNKQDLLLYREYLTAQVKVSPATWNRRKAALRCFARWAMDSGHLAGDPTRHLPGAALQQLAPRWLDARQAGKLERAVERAITTATTETAKRKAIRNRAIIYLMLKAGLRESEVCALNVSDVVMSERKGHVVVRYGKGSKSRICPLNIETLNAVRAHMPYVPFSQAMFQAMFIGKRLDRLQVSGVQRLVSALGRAAGLDKLTPHQLRHTCAKNLLESGAKITEVSALLGHQKLETTYRYVQPSQTDLERAVEKI